jgi:Domain of unknown function (DUF4331)/Cupin
MSHHLDSPVARQDIRLDITDLYVFRGEVGTVFVINVCHSIAGEIPTPGYHPEGMYEIKVDLNRDAVEELTYRLTFDPRDVAGKQRYVLRRVAGAAATDLHATGTMVCQGTTGEIVTTSSGLRVWAGRAGDPFWIEPDVFHAVGHALHDGTTLNLGDWTPARAKNLFAWQTVYSMVLEVPDQELLAEAGDSRRIGVWAVSTLATDAGGWRSINRVGLPMLPPLFTQYDEDLGDRLNAGCPSGDFKNYGEAVIKAVSGAVTVFASGGKSRTFDYQAGDVGYVPRDMGHYVENTGEEPLVFLALFRSDHYADISLAQWMGVLPPELVKAHLNVDDKFIANLPKDEPLVR